MLEKATICGILAKAGPRRTRILGIIYKDERIKNSDNFIMLEKMFLERVIKK